MKIIYRLTRSEQMALLDILAEHLYRGGTLEFINCSENPPVTTHIADLMMKLSEFKEMEP